MRVNRLKPTRRFRIGLRSSYEVRMVLALALKFEKAVFASLDHYGTRPQRILTISRSPSVRSFMLELIPGIEDGSSLEFSAEIQDIKVFYSK